MKDKLQWVTRLKWWQMLILFPAIFTILGTSISGGYKFVYHDILGNPIMSTIEKRNLTEFKKHFQESPSHKEVVDVNSSHIEMAYYGSDSCMLVTRRSKDGNTSMMWLPMIKDKLITYTDAKTEIWPPSAFAAELTPMASAHDGDPYFIDVKVSWVNPFEFVVERAFRDGCIGRFRVYAPTGATCCWEWVVYRHKG